MLSNKKTKTKKKNNKNNNNKKQGKRTNKTKKKMPKSKIWNFTFVWTTLIETLFTYAWFLGMNLLCTPEEVSFEIVSRSHVEKKRLKKVK